jgi:omega-3 fatty acid desaturase (delta-15 desaturase)
VQTPSRSTHHANHGHVENDESWHPVTKKLYDQMVRTSGFS